MLELREQILQLLKQYNLGYTFEENGDLFIHANWDTDFQVAFESLVLQHVNKAFKGELV